MMRFETLTSLRDLDAGEFDGLDPGCGPVGSYARLVQLERDRRWSTEYLCARERGILLAAVPLYRLSKGDWPDPSYDPASWGLGHLGPATDLTVVGGRSGLLTSLHVASAISGTSRHLRLIEELVAREFRQALILPYLRDSDLRPWREVLGSRLECRALGADARFDPLLPPEAVARNVRQTLRKDQRMFERLEVESSGRTWSEVRSFAAGLIARNNQAQGLPDAEQLVDFRVRQWEACEGVSVVVRTVQARGEHGVLVCLVWRDWMDLQEAGITGARSDIRRTLYAQLLFHQPVLIARERGVRQIRAGLKAEQAKAIRGASFVPLTSGAFTLSSGHTDN